MNKAPIDMIVNSLVPRLPAYKKVGLDPFQFSGYELMLSGVKEFEGKPLEMTRIYNVPIPRIKYHDHEKKMRKAWRYHGLEGVYDYLKPFLTAESLEKLKKRLMHVA